MSAYLSVCVLPEYLLILSLYNADMSSTAFIEPLPVIEFVAQLLNRDVSARPLSDADRVKVSIEKIILLPVNVFVSSF